MKEGRGHADLILFLSLRVRQGEGGGAERKGWADNIGGLSLALECL